jgi:hypothetical protein
MFDLALLPELSRQYCVAICAFLVPANLLATLQTLAMTVLQNRSWLRQTVAIAGIGYAGLMVLHVFSWLSIGVIQAPTFILLSLGTVCFILNSWAMVRPHQLQQLLQRVWQHLTAGVRQYLPIKYFPDGQLVQKAETSGKV